MRISADINDKGYENYMGYSCDIRVFLNGKQISHCVTADEAEGFVLIEKKDINGNLTIGSNGKIETVCHYGIVKITRGFITKFY